MMGQVHKLGAGEPWVSLGAPALLRLQAELDSFPAPKSTTPVVSHEKREARWGDAGDATIL